VLLEEGDVIYKTTDRDNTNLVQANFAFKKVQVSDSKPITKAKQKEAASVSPEYELL
jgi:hypothetical protein